MKLWIDLFSTDYGLMSLIVIVATLLLVSFFYFFVMRKIRESTPTPDISRSTPP